MRDWLLRICPLESSAISKGPSPFFQSGTRPLIDLSGSERGRRIFPSTSSSSSGRARARPPGLGPSQSVRYYYEARSSSSARSPVAAGRGLVVQSDKRIRPAGRDEDRPTVAVSRSISSIFELEWVEKLAVGEGWEVVPVP